MFDKLNLLKLLGYYPDTILDIGAYHGKWTTAMKKIFDMSEYYLFEGIDYEELKSFSNVFNVILNDKVEIINWYEKRNTGDSMFKEKTGFFADCKVYQRQTIDLNLLIEQTDILQESRNIFIKIDCQGAEIPILKGATSLYTKTNFILLEMPLFGVYNEGVPSFSEHISFMDSIGFIPYDILESHYINGFNMQVDMLFINKLHPFTSAVNELLLRI
jgi:FkbM family methyltransferase